jgi:hypothetical protein
MYIPRAFALYFILTSARTLAFSRPGIFAEDALSAFVKKEDDTIYTGVSLYIIYK